MTRSVCFLIYILLSTLRDFLHFVWKVAICCVIELKSYLATADYINKSKQFYIDNIGWYTKRHIPEYLARIYCVCLVYCEHLCIICMCWYNYGGRPVRKNLNGVASAGAPGGNTVRCITPAYVEGITTNNAITGNRKKSAVFNYLPNL